MDGENPSVYSKAQVESIRKILQGE
jgi:hypothetical protein